MSTASNRKLTDDQVRRAERAIRSGVLIKEVAQALGVSTTHLARMRQRLTPKETPCDV